MEWRGLLADKANANELLAEPSAMTPLNGDTTPIHDFQTQQKEDSLII